MLLYPYQINPSYRYDTDRTYLEEFFPKRTLIITDNMLNALAHTQHILTDIVKQFDNVEQIVIDVTHNPYFSDQIELTKAYELLAKLAPTVILSGDFLLFYNPRPNFVFFPVFLWAFSQKNPVWYKNVVFDCAQDKTKLLCCFNKSPWRHRILLFLSLVERPWFNQIQYTFGNFDTRYYDYELSELTQIIKRINLFSIKIYYQYLSLVTTTLIKMM
jgi:hypothetical protein